MRVLFGIVLGAILTAGGAYYRDTTYASPASTNASRPLVNWDVAGEIADNATHMLRRQVDDLLPR